MKILISTLLLALGVFVLQSKAFADTAPEGVIIAKALAGDPEAHVALIELGNQGNVLIQFGLGVMHQDGLGIRPDHTKAVNWYRKAAEQGHTGAQNALGVMYYGGKEVPQDYIQAAFWFRKMAEQGDAVGQAMLGSMYEKGEGLTASFVTAYQWYFLASINSSENPDLKHDTASSMDGLNKKMTEAEVADAKKAAAEWLTLNPTPK